MPAAPAHRPPGLRRDAGQEALHSQHLSMVRCLPVDTGFPFRDVLACTEAAWAAGFFDGEGSTVLMPASNDGQRRRYLTPRCSISQHAPEGEPCVPLLRFQQAVGGLGSVNGPRTYTGYTTPRWTWSTNRADEAEVVLAILWPYLSAPKRAQAMPVLTEYRADLATRRAYTRQPISITTNNPRS